MVSVLEREAEHQDRHRYDRQREPDDDQARFRVDVSMSAHVVVADGVVDPVAEDRADDGADYGREEEEAWRVGEGLFLLSFSLKGKCGVRERRTYRGCKV